MPSNYGPGLPGKNYWGQTYDEMMSQKPAIDAANKQRTDKAAEGTLAGQTANQLGSQEQGFLHRQAPGLGQVFSAGLEGARANQQAALAAQQGVMNGPSLAGMQAGLAAGQARGAMGGAGAGGNPLAARAAMTGGNAALGANAMAAGKGVGEEYAQRMSGLAGGVNELGQGDLSSQQGAEAIAQAQRQLYLKQLQQNEQMAQGYEQNYANVQNAYTQQAQAVQAAELSGSAAKTQQMMGYAGAGLQAVGTMAMASDRRLKIRYRGLGKVGE